MTSRSVLFVLALLAAPALTAIPASPARAASFDCARAKAPDERAICADLALNDQDVRLALLYELDGHFLPMGGRGAMMDDQVAWLRRRHACGADRACLSRLYAARIATLRAVIDERVATHGPF